MGRQGRPSRAVLIYLLAIVAPAVVLLYLGLKSIERQREAIRTLAASNRRLSQERLAAERERRVREAAQQYLRHQDQAPPFRGQSPVVRHGFVLEDGVLHYPRLRMPPPRVPQDLPALFREAEANEFRGSHIEQAVDLYQRVASLPVPDPVKALALNGAARCLRKLGRAEEAVRAWETVLNDYGTLLDISHRPYALTARFEIGRLEGLYEEVVSGRWELSAEQYDYYLNRLNRKAPQGNLFDFGRELEEHFRHLGPLREGDLYALALPNWRIYYQYAPGAEERIVGIAVDPAWIRNALEPEIRAQLGIPDSEPEIGRGGLLIYGGATFLVVAVLILGIILLFRDVNRELRMNQLRAEFVSGVSHELKTPLTLIRLYAETLARGGSFPEEERQGFYGIITRECERLTQLIEKVLSFSRIERGEKQYRLAEGDLEGAVSHTVGIYQQYLAQQGFQVETSLAAGIPPVRFDRDAVAQAVVNLIDNAVKYSGETKYVGLRLWPEGGAVVFEVEDRGIGIAKEQQSKIFERFYRGANGSGRGGYGLGLYLVRHIMEAHGGRVEVESEPGRGSRFRLVFPAS